MFDKRIQILFFIILVVGLFVIVYVQRDRFMHGLKHIYINIESAIYPRCSRPISYRVGEFSDKFGISQAQFIEALYEAEQLWENTVDQDLFSYDRNGDLVVNLIYDVRQQTTDTLKNLDSSLDQSRTSYELLKQSYQQKYIEYEKLRLDFDVSAKQYESERTAYERQVAMLNKQGGANEAQYARLEVIRNELNQTVSLLRAEQQKLQVLSKEINALVEELNERARELNLKVDKYNTVGGDVGEEFDGGVYRVDESGRAIDVFQFDSRQQLVRLLAHEFGHALGIDHVDDPDAIMYRLNQSSVVNLTVDDIVALKAVCEIK